ncbi:uncharacterized protein [Epargyreus clarus]|uniref:uncharacterized protein n=1 Tax=Epargyreus clarus TaxID=520877 RepID=UPI003C2FC616
MSHCSFYSCLKMALRVLCVLLLLQIVTGNENHKNEGFMDHISTGMKFAQNFLGSESVAIKVADFVVRAFQTVNNPSDVKKRPPQSYVDDYSGSKEQLFEKKRPDYNLHEVPTGSPWRYLVRLLGLQPNQISAVAVNALVFVAQMITTFLAGPRRPSKPFRSDDPMDWILSKKSKNLQELIPAAKNESLPDLIEELIEQHENKEETSCIRLLVCKISPFVSKMQKAVFGKENETDFNEKVRGAAIMYRHLPSKEEINGRSDVCEQRYKDCDLNE